MATPAKPIILYDNILDAGTVTATSEASGFPIENIFDWRTYTLWKPTGTATQNIDTDYGSNVTADALAVVGHDLGTQTISLEVFHSSSATFTSGAVSVGTFSFTNDKPKYISLTSGTDRYWRVQLTSLDAACFIGQLALGPKMQMERLPQDGYDVDAQKTKGKTFTSKTGNFLGAAEAFTERTINAQFRFLTDAWVTANLLPFLHNHFLKLKPFFFVPDLTNLSTRVYFLRASDNPQVSLQSESTYRHWTLTASGVKQDNF